MHSDIFIRKKCMFLTNYIKYTLRTSRILLSLVTVRALCSSNMNIPETYSKIMTVYMAYFMGNILHTVTLGYNISQNTWSY